MKVSVIIPCYNSEKTIDFCLQSVLKQSYPVYEIIIIDDGSTDNTVYIVDNIIETNETNITIHLIKQENSGPSKARNKGVDYASGNWIAFLDSDDFWIDNKIEKQLEFLNKNPNIAMCASSLIKASNNLNQKDDHQKVFFNDLLFNNRFLTSGVIVKSEVIKKNKFNEKQKYSEDYRTWLLICYSNECVSLSFASVKHVIQKEVFGESGLSSRLWEMEKGEFSNFIYLWKKKYISFFTLIKCSSYSFVKYLRRVFKSHKF